MSDDVSVSEANDELDSGAKEAEGRECTARAATC